MWWMNSRTAGGFDFICSHTQAKTEKIWCVLGWGVGVVFNYIRNHLYLAWPFHGRFQTMVWGFFISEELNPRNVMNQSMKHIQERLSFTYWCYVLNFLQKKKIESPKLQDHRRWPYMEIGSLQRKLKRGQQGRHHSKDCCPYRGNLDRETRMEGSQPYKDGGLEWGIYRPDCLKIAAHCKTQGGCEEDGFQRNIVLSTSWFQTYPPQLWHKKSLLHGIHPAYGTLFSPSKWIQSA